MSAIQQVLLASAAAVGATLSISGTPVTTGTEYEHGVGSTYAGFTATASGGTSPYTYSVASGTLPTGITLNSSTGAVSGTPGFESAGTYSGIVIRATDAASATANLASFTLTIAFKDPYYSNTKLLFDYDEVNGNQVFDDQSFANHASLTTTAGVTGGVAHSTTVTPLYGTSSIAFPGSGSGLRYGSNPDFLLGSSTFTIDFTARPTTVTGTQALIGVWQAAPNLGWVLSFQGSQVGWNVSTTGTDNNADILSASGTVVINTWARWRFDFNGTKYRLYKNGTMIASSTTLRTIFNSNLNLAIGASSALSLNFFGNCRGIRLTKGTARTASDSGYTISNRAFPTS